MKNSAALVVLSGGQDSTTCLYLAKKEFRDVHAITFDYGQRHALEITAARTIARIAAVTSHEVIELGAVLKGTSPLVSPSTEVEKYADAQSLPGGIEKTFVPMRNALFLVLAFNRAVVLDCEAIYTGVSQEDYGGYPDCRFGFIQTMERAGHLALAESVKNHPRVFTPLMFVSKKETVKISAEMPECLAALAYTHTCYQGQFPPCGACHACLLRAKGFAEAGVVDPLVARATAAEESI